MPTAKVHLPLEIKVGHAKLRERKIKTPSLHLDPLWVLRFGIIKVLFIMKITFIMFITKIMFVIIVIKIIKKPVPSTVQAKNEKTADLWSAVSLMV